MKKLFLTALALIVVTVAWVNFDAGSSEPTSTQEITEETVIEPETVNLKSPAQIIDLPVVKGKIVDLPVVKGESSSEPAQTIKVNGAHVIYITGPIGGNAAGINKEILEKAKSGKPLFLLINSPGGSVLDGATIVTTMQSVKVPVYTVCTQICASMAFIIHQYGAKRYAVDRSILMAHPASGAFQGPFPIITSRFKLFSSYVDNMDKFIAKRMGISLEKFKALTDNELWVEARSAIPMNLLDKIVFIDTDATDSSVPILLEQVKTRENDLMWF